MVTWCTHNHHDNPQIDGIVFELVKTRHEAKMELTISPITFLFSDSFKRPTLDMHLAHGFMQLQGVQVLMCGLYSGVGKYFESFSWHGLTFVAVEHVPSLNFVLLISFIADSLTILQDRSLMVLRLSRKHFNNYFSNSWRKVKELKYFRNQ